VKTTLTRSDFEDFLIRLYFTDPKNPLAACSRRAYLDFSRTLHGIGPQSGELFGYAERKLRNRLELVRNRTLTQEQFDDWHRKTCRSLAVTYAKHGYESFFVGQAQKWVNMTLKYIFVFGDARIPGFAELYPQCHVPLDNVLLDRLRSFHFPTLPCAWSRLDDYNFYLDLQRWMRESFDLPPLDNEFRLWMGQAIELKRDP
jgi:hypothetical protein